MKQYRVEIETIATYLQARFSESAKASLAVKAGKRAKAEDDESWKEFLYQEEDGQIYIPAIQIKNCLVNGGKGIKKKPFGSFKDIVKAYFFIEEEKIYIGKKKPDFIKVSYPARKDGMRVKISHPAFNVGLSVAFTLTVTNDDIDASTIKMIIEKGGLENGIGAWRPEHGRFILKKFECVV